MKSAGEEITDNDKRRKPDWLKTRLTKAKDYSYIKKHLSHFGLHTICESGKCPNIAECWAARTATFMILGDICTRNCSFCNVQHSKPLPPDPEEPLKLAQAIREIKLKHCVITSVTRDDLAYEGAEIWAEVIRTIKEINPEITLETLIPDFNGNTELIRFITNEHPDIISHNLETVERLTPFIRSKAKYHTSLKVLSEISKSGITAKSGLMCGLGEEKQEIIQAMDHLLESGCCILTLGQYLQPSKLNIPVSKYYSPDEFEELKGIAIGKGFLEAECGPFVRSSYHAEKHIPVLPKTV